MKDFIFKLLLFPSVLLLSTQAMAVGLVWGEANWGDSDWQVEGIAPTLTPTLTLTLVTPPGGTLTGQVVQGPPAVQVVDSETNPVASTTVSVSLTGGTFSGGTLSAVSGADGVVVFPDLLINQTGEFSLLYTVVDTEITLASSAFSVQAPPPPPPPAPEPDPDPVPVPTPPPAPEPDDNETIDNIISVIVIPVNEGDIVSQETFNSLAEGAAASANLAQNLVNGIDDANDDDVIDALNTFGDLASISGTAARQSTTTGDTTGATSGGDSGKQMLNSFSTLLSALDSKTNNETAPATLSSAQKEVVQQAAVKAVASAVNVLTALPASGSDRQAVLQDLGKIISSSVNLGVPLSQEQSDSLLEAAEQSSSADSDVDSQLDNSIPIKPANKALLSRDSLNQALGGSVPEEELNQFLQELANAINPADVSIGGVTGEESLNEGFAGSLDGGSSGTVSFDPDTGVITFSISDSVQDSDGLRTISALTVGVDIVGRVISANVVASGFPDGVSMRANGAMVIASNRIASLVVPASADPVNFYADLRVHGLKTSVADDGNVTVRDGDLYFSGTFDFEGVEPGTGERSSTGIVLPKGRDESDENYYFTVTYRDGRKQKIQPFVMADNFLNSLKEKKVNATISRDTGVISTGGLRFRPSYFVIPANAETEAFRQKKADETGLAFRVVDANDDGIVDVQVISAQGVQLVFGMED